MLVLSRTPSQSIVLSDPESGKILARVVVRDVRGKQAKIAVDAPDNVMIDRYEIYERKQQERTQAA